MAYIDSDVALQIIDNYAKTVSEEGKVIVNAVRDIVTIITPTADVVEVVRCKDCIYYNSNCCFNRQWDFESSTEVPLVRENDFCSYGERKESEVTEE